MGEQPDGYRVIECGGTGPSWIYDDFALNRAPMSNMLTPSDLRVVRKANESMREALGFEVDMVGTRGGS